MALLEILEGSAFCAGLAMGTASILSVGPNNLTLIREGLVRGRIALVSSLIWASYLVLLLSALALTETVAAQGMIIRPLLSWLGLLALCWFAFLSLRAYATASSTFHHATFERETTATCIRRTLAIVWLNPLTYVELLFLPAAIGGTFLLPICRVLFILGLIVMATAACFGYSFFGGLCAQIFKRKDIVRKFDLVSGIILTSLACIMATALVIAPSSPVEHQPHQQLQAAASAFHR